jgi:hypothetical protein
VLKSSHSDFTAERLSECPANAARVLVEPHREIRQPSAVQMYVITEA